MQILQENQKKVYDKLIANFDFTVSDWSSIGDAQELISSKQSCYFHLYYRISLIACLFVSSHKAHLLLQFYSCQNSLSLVRNTFFFFRIGFYMNAFLLVVEIFVLFCFSQY